MTTQHTPGRLKVQHPHAGERGWEIAVEPGLEQVCQDVTEANARRLVACWNACEGIETEALEGHALQVIAADRFQKVYDATTRRKELLAALKDLCKLALNGESVLFTAEYDRARAAIAKAEGAA